jgi:hypothetical protein
MDAIEDSVGTVLWLVAQMCLQFMEQGEVAILLGDEMAANWQKLDADSIRKKFTPRVVGGSTLKPTSRAKKEQALQISQIVGQFTRATPIAAVVALKVLATAFDNVLISQEDWELIYKAIIKEASGPSPEQQQQQETAQQGNLQAGAQMHERAMAAQQGAQPGAGAGAGPPQGAQPGAGGASGAGGPQIDDIASIVQEVARLIDGLPPRLKQHLGIELARGKPIADIAGQLIQQMQQGTAA